MTVNSSKGVQKTNTWARYEWMCFKHALLVGDVRQLSTRKNCVCAKRLHEIHCHIVPQSALDDRADWCLEQYLGYMEMGLTIEVKGFRGQLGIA